MMTPSDAIRLYSLLQKHASKTNTYAPKFYASNQAEVGLVHTLTITEGHNHIVVLIQVFVGGHHHDGSVRSEDNATVGIIYRASEYDIESQKTWQTESVEEAYSIVIGILMAA